MGSFLNTDWQISLKPLLRGTKLHSAYFNIWGVKHGGCLLKCFAPAHWLSCWIIKTTLKSCRLAQDWHVYSMPAFTLLLAFQLFIYRKTEEIRAHAACRRGFLKSQCFNVRSTRDWQYGQSLSSDLQRHRVDERVAVTPPGDLQWHGGDPSESLTPLRYTTVAQEAVWDVNKGAAAQTVLVTAPLNLLREVKLWNSFRFFMSASETWSSIWLITDFWISCYVAQSWLDVGNAIKAKFPAFNLKFSFEEQYFQFLIMPL